MIPTLVLPTVIQMSQERRAIEDPVLFALEEIDFFLLHQALLAILF